MRVVVVLLVLAGCDRLFKLDHVGPGDARYDAAPDAFDLDAGCSGYDLALYPGSRYRIITQSLFAWDASDICTSDTAGFAHLAVAATRDELDVLIATLRSKQMTRWWLGAVQPVMVASPDEAWLWMTGENVAADLWDREFEPNDGDLFENDHQEQFAIIDSQSPGLLDLTGSIATPALCECDGRAVAPSAAMALSQSRL